MIRAAALAVLLALPFSAGAQEVTGDVAKTAAAASAGLKASVEAMQAAKTAKDRVSALTTTIKSYETGLGALREALRQAELRETTLTLQFDAKRERLSQLLGVLSSLDADQGPLLLLHPGGPLGTARSGMMLADVTPALYREAETLRSNLQELADLRGFAKRGGSVVGGGVAGGAGCRAALNQAISDRTDLPKRFTEDPEVLKALLESADTLDAFSAGLSPDDYQEPGFAEAKGRLAWPVLGDDHPAAGRNRCQGCQTPRRHAGDAAAGACHLTLGGDDPLSGAAARLRKCDDH